MTNIELDNPAFAGKSVTIAFPRNPLHVKLLVDNLESIDLVIFREEFMRKHVEMHFPTNSIFIGRETRPSLRKGLGNIIAVRSANKAYYNNVFTRILSLKISKFIIFLENEPAECLIIDTLGYQKVELWEEGVMHYVDIFNKPHFYLRKLFQLISGFYPKSIFRLRIDRTKLTVRDRYLNKNLVYLINPRTGIPIKKIAFLGNALIDDKVINSNTLASTLITISEQNNLPIDYLPHPRESVKSISELEEIFHKNDSNITVIHGLTGSLEYCLDNDYVLYLSPLSSTLLDLQKYEKSAWVPGLLGLKDLEKGIIKANVFPISCLQTTDEINKFIASSRDL